MKTNATFLLWMLLFVSSGIQAQPYQPLLSENAVWTTRYEEDNAEMNGGLHFIYHAKYAIVGDSMFNGMTYKKCYVCDNWNVTDDCWQFLALLREDTLLQQVHVLPYETETELLLYDFSLSVGNTVTVYRPKFDSTQLLFSRLSDGAFFAGNTGCNNRWRRKKAPLLGAGSWQFRPRRMD